MRYLLLIGLLSLACNPASGSDALKRKSSWQSPDREQMVELLAEGLQGQGLPSARIATCVEFFRTNLAGKHPDPLENFVIAASTEVPAVNEIYQQALASPASVRLDDLHAISESLRPSLEAWLGRTLVQLRLYDEAKPLLDFVDPLATVDPAAVMFYR